MDVDAAAPGQRQDLLLEQLAEGDDQHEIGSERTEMCDEVGRIDRGDPFRADPQIIRGGADRRRRRAPVSSGGAVELSADADELQFRSRRETTGIA